MVEPVLAGVIDGAKQPIVARQALSGRALWAYLHQARRQGVGVVPEERVGSVHRILQGEGPALCCPGLALVVDQETGDDVSGISYRKVKDLLNRSVAP